MIEMLLGDRDRLIFILKRAAQLLDSTGGVQMGFISGLLKVATGAAAGVAAVTMLPIFGAVGTITAVGIAVGAVVGAAAGVADEVMESKKKQASSDLECR